MSLSQTSEEEESTQLQITTNSDKPGTQLDQKKQSTEPLDAPQQQLPLDLILSHVGKNLLNPPPLPPQ